jgi:glutamyl-tRNA synthetase
MGLLANPKQKVTPELLPKVLKALAKTLDLLPDNKWTIDTLKEAVQKTMKKEELGQGQILWPLRAALTGLPFSPGAYEVAAALGKTATMARLVSAQKIAA